MIKDGKWYRLWKDMGFEISYRLCGHFDSHPEIHISMFGYHQVFKLPWTNDKWSDECDPPRWGIAVSDNTFWLYKGGKGNLNGGSKYWAWDLPFVTKVHMDDKHLVEVLDGFSSKMIKVSDLEKEKPYWRDNPKILKRYYDYTDKYDGQIIPTIYYVEHREWRRKWLTWTKLFSSVQDYIEIEFKTEVGSQKGSWKGGAMACSYDLLPGETPQECIKRMEQTRDF